MLSLISFQPEVVRRSYWARHWACAVDVLELLAAKSAFTRAGGRLVAEVEGEDIIDVALKDYVLELMGTWYWPGEFQAGQ